MLENPADRTRTARATIPARIWGILAVSVVVAAASAAVTAGTAFLLPALHTDRGLSLATAGTLVAMPGLGTAATLVAWGWLVDRTGERLVLTLGALGSALALAGAAVTHSPRATGAFFLLAGGSAASANSASGRVVVGWFSPDRRGLAMGIRQMSQPLGAALAAATMPVLARGYGIGWALGVPLALCAVAAVATWLVVVDPPRVPRADAPAAQSANPYRGGGYLVRVHAVSMLLVLPQGLMQSYLLVWLIVGHGWTAGPAGAVVTVAQLAGAAGRIGVGAWSDRLGTRMVPLRRVAVTGAIASLALGAAELAGVPTAVAVVLAVLVTVVSVADNGLAFTGVAEYAGPFWSGRALGVQNTAQFLAVSAATPLLALVISHVGYWSAFVGAGVVAAVAAPLVPARDRSR